METAALIDSATGKMSADDDVSTIMSDHEHAVVGQLQDGVTGTKVILVALFFNGITCVSMDIEVGIDGEHVTIFPDLDTAE